MSRYQNWSSWAWHLQHGARRQTGQTVAVTPIPQEDGDKGDEQTEENPFKHAEAARGTTGAPTYGSVNGPERKCNRASRHNQEGHLDEGQRTARRGRDRFERRHYHCRTEQNEQGPGERGKHGER